MQTSTSLLRIMGREVVFWFTDLAKTRLQRRSINALNARHPVVRIAETRLE